MKDPRNLISVCPKLVEKKPACLLKCQPGIRVSATRGKNRRYTRPPFKGRGTNPLFLEGLGSLWSNPKKLSVKLLLPSIWKIIFCLLLGGSGEGHGFCLVLTTLGTFVRHVHHFSAMEIVENKIGEHGWELGANWTKDLASILWKIQELVFTSL